MYSEHSAAEFRDYLELAPGYEVEAFLAYGCWDLNAETEQLPLLRAALDELGLEYQLRRFPTLSLGHSYELTIEGRIYWYSPVMGTAVLAQYLHSASLLGSKRNVLLGIVGGLAPGMRTGDFIVPTSVRGNDNARFYDRENAQGVYEPDHRLSEQLAASVPKSIRLWRGPTVTCEMMFAETLQDVMQWGAEGALGVEMEAALTFSASKFFSIPAAALLYVADNLVEGQTLLTPEYSSQKLELDQVRQQQYTLGLRALLNSKESR